MSLEDKAVLVADCSCHADKAVRRWARMTHGQEYQHEVAECHKASIQCAVVLGLFFGIMIGAMILDALTCHVRV